MSTLTKQQLQQIKAKLPHRYMEGLRDRLPNKNISYPLISQVMNGRKNDYYNIIETAIEWALEREKQNSLVIKKANKFINNN